MLAHSTPRTSLKTESFKSMANKKFLEEYPLYRKFKTDLRNTEWTNPVTGSNVSLVMLNSIPKPAINLNCKSCSSEQTFNMVGNYYIDTSTIPQAHNSFCEVLYRCEGCKRNSQRYFLHFFNDNINIRDDKNGDDIKQEWLFVRKVGQFPAWNISMDKNLEQLLGVHVDFYKKGLTNESQSYGIGAYAYFRRITEDIIDNLLDSISKLLTGEDKIKYEKALADTKQTRVTKEKIDLVKDLLPAILCRGDKSFRNTAFCFE